jgi:putative transposase
MRKSRVLRDDVPYHVVVRTNRKDLLLETSLAKGLFQETIIAAKEKHVFRIDNYVIMDNHVHLLIWPSCGAALPTLMKWILGGYTMKYNRVFESCGHVWGDRYYSRPIPDFGDYLMTSDYIDANPTRACLVEDPKHWAWGGLFHHQIGRRDITEAPIWLKEARPEHSVIPVP